MKKNILNIIVAMVSLLMTINVAAQTSRTVSGTVKDSAGEPVMGAVILLDGKAGIGVSTDIDGKYTLKLPVTQGVLKVQCLGYSDQTVSLGSGNTYDFVLKEDSEMLERVVVVGYGTMKESDITGSVSQVKMDETNAARSTSIDQMLKGRTAGVQVQTSTGSPGAGINIKIRGNSSFNGGGEPLYVVDGIIINSSQGNLNVMSKAGLEEEETSGLLGINPQDIASMEILKDASATAIYGALGANGVILITTKSAEKEKPQVTFSAGLELARRSNTISIMDIDQYSEYLEAKDYGSGLDKIWVNPGDHSYGYKVKPVYWQDYMTRTAQNQRYYVSVANKNKSTSYMFSASYKSTQGVVLNSDLDQFSARLNLDQKITKKFKVGLKLNVSKIDSNMMQGASSGGLTSNTSAIRAMLNSRPYYNADDDDEEAAGLTEDSGARPDRWLRDFVSKRAEYRVIPNITADYKINKWLNYKLTAGGDYRVKKSTQWKGPFVTYDTNWALAGIGSNQSMVYNIDNMLMFDKKFGQHNISGTLGTTFHQSMSTSETRQGYNIIQYNAQYHAMNSAPLTSTLFSYGESAAATLSFLARAVYNYKGRYVLTATFRRDGSSRFSRENRYANFPSFAFAWRANEEPWFDFDKISTLKFRVGWGRVGNQAISSYQTLSNYGSVWYPDHSEGNEKMGIVGLAPGNLANTGLKWETTEQTNAGVDLKLNRNRLSFTFDVYDKTTFDLLQNVSVPVTTGYSKMWMNLGTINNRGVEFSMDATLLKKHDFQWDIFGNISHNVNKIVEIGIPSEGEGGAPFFRGSSIGTGNYCKTPVNIFIEGQPMGLFYGIRTDGIIQEGETGPGLTEGEVFYPGAVKYVDLDGNGYIDDNDRQVVGNPNPDFTFGFGTTFSWKNLTLDVQFEGVYGNQIANINLIQENDISHNTMNLRYEAFKEAWTPEHTNTTYPAIGAYTTAENKFFTSRCVEDGSYLRLSSVSLSYDIPIRNSQSFIEGINLTLSGSNLWILTNYSGWDPDVNIYGSNIMRMGCDFGSYPKARSISLDVKLRF